MVLQNVTVNTQHDENGKPVAHWGKGVFLGTGSKIIGNGRIGNHVSLGVNAVVYKRDIDDDSIVICNCDSGKIEVRNKNGNCFAQKYFDVII